ncbi:hypothetical protein GOBAR_AA05145 [Gossypium barbadense]|uniref:Uncharacterized protein n=2 Tax=Gossypium barbadense TaxID=3634 RepID=A0A2P5YIL4_GOSBA|nr:hypothetical protein GOBAR_AA05145 [Gossypium barbadense]
MKGAKLSPDEQYLPLLRDHIGVPKDDTLEDFSRKSRSPLNKVLKFLWMMKSFVAIFFAILLFLATMDADGKRMTLEKEREPSNHQLGRKAGIGAKDDMDLTGEDGSDIELIASKNRLIDSRHHIYMNDTSPIPRKHP